LAWSKRLHSQEDAISQLRKELQTSNDDGTKWAERYWKLEDECQCEQMHQQSHAQAQEIHSLRTQLCETNYTIEAMRAKKDRLVAQVTATRDDTEFKNAQSKIKELQKSLATVNAQLKTEQKNAKGLEDSLELAYKESGKEDEKHEATQQELKKSLQAQAQTSSNHQMAMNRVIDELHSAKSRIEELNESLESANSALNIGQGTGEELKKILGDVYEEFKKEQNRHNETRKQLNESMLAQAEMSSEHQMTFSGLNDALSTTNSKANKLEMDNTELKKKLEEVQSLAQEYYNALQEKADGDTEMHDSVEDHTACETQRRDLELINGRLAADIGRGKVEHEELERQNATLQGERDAMQRERDSLERERNLTLMSMKVNPLGETVVKLKRDLRAAEQARDGSSRNNIVYCKQNQQLKTDLTLAQNQLAGLKPTGSKRPKAMDSNAQNNDAGPSKVLKADPVPAMTNPARTKSPPRSTPPSGPPAPTNPLPRSTPTSGPPANTPKPFKFPTQDDVKGELPTGLVKWFRE